MKICMVARDVAHSNAFKLVAEKLVGQYIVSYLGGGSPISASLEEITKSVRESDVLLCGMASSPDLVKEELAAIDAAHSAGVPVILYADTYGAVKRQWFESVRDFVNAVFVVSEKEAEEVEELFEYAKPILSGNPMVESAHFPKTTREEIRKRFDVREDEKVIVCPGYKYPAINIPTMIAILDAAAYLRIYSPELRIFVFFSMHPGDERWQKNNSYYHELLANFLECREVTDLDNLRVKITCGKASNSEDKISTSDLLPAADLVVATMSTIEQEAACLRIPVIEYLTNIALDRMEKNFGTRDWEACEQGIAENINGDSDSLAEAISDYFCIGEMGESMKNAQELHYPKPKKQGYAVDIMVKTVLRCGENK